jgi:hypothetical protein
MGRKIVKGGDYRPSVATTREAKDALATWIENNYRPLQESIISTIILWFVKQPKSVQQVVLDQVPGEMKGAYAAALEQLAREVREGRTPAFDHLYGESGLTGLPNTKRESDGTDAAQPSPEPRQRRQPAIARRKE